MSNISDLARKITFNNESITGSVTIPDDVQVVEITAFPNGGDNSATDGINVRFNSDTGSNYTTKAKEWSQNSGYTYASATGTSIELVKLFDTTSPAVDQCCTRMVLYPRATTEYNYGFIEKMMGDDGTENETVDTIFFQWQNTTNDITSVSFLSPGAASLSADIEIKFIR